MPRAGCWRALVSHIRLGAVGNEPLTRLCAGGCGSSIRFVGGGGKEDFRDGC